MITSYHVVALSAALILAQAFAEWVREQEPVYVERKLNQDGKPRYEIDRP
jgi:hypothetical protein